MQRAVLNEQGNGKLCEDFLEFLEQSGCLVYTRLWPMNWFSIATFYCSFCFMFGAGRLVNTIISRKL
jgi:hypothetical protein